MVWRIGWALMGWTVLFPIEARPAASASLGSHDDWEGFQHHLLARGEVFRDGPSGSTSQTLPDPAAGLPQSEIPLKAMGTPTDSLAFHASPAMFAGMRRGALIRVEVKSDRVFEGPFLEARVEGLAFEDAADTVVPYGDITSAWQWSSNRPKAMKQSAIFGSVVGGIVLGLVSYAHRETGFCWGFGTCQRLEGS